MFEEACNRECLSDLARLAKKCENNEINDSEFRMFVIDRLYELDDIDDLIID